MKKLFLSVAAAILAFPVLADEGMWLLPLLKQQKFAEMQALGLRLSSFLERRRGSFWRWLYGRDDLSGRVGADESSLWL